MPNGNKFIQVILGRGENELFALDEAGQLWRRIHCADCGLLWQKEAGSRGHDQKKHKSKEGKSS